MTDLKKLDEELTTYVRPTTFPLAIRMLSTLDEIPSRAKRPVRDLGVQVAICQTLGMARRYGWELAITHDDIGCPLTYVPFGFVASNDFLEEGNACAGIYTATPQAGARTEAQVPHFPLGKYKAIAIAPLSRASFEPDVICVYGNSAQVMRLVQGALYQTGGAVHSLSTGRIDCSEIIIRTMLTNECQYILPCTGDRMFGLTADDEMVFAMPADKVEQVMEGLRGTRQGGIRYPVTSFMRFAPQFPPSYEKLREELNKG